VISASPPRRYLEIPAVILSEAKNPGSAPWTAKGELWIFFAALKMREAPWSAAAELPP